MESRTLLFPLFTCICLIVCLTELNEAVNERPIIGILSQAPSNSSLEGHENENYTAYIAASYVKLMESAGARVVPIMIDQQEEYYVDLASKLNGILFPGGSNAITNVSGYGMAGQILYFEILKRNAMGIHLPLWATCLGFEMLSYLASNYYNILTSCSAQDISLSLEFEPGYETSQLFGNTSAEILNILSTQNVTSNFHKWCVTEQNFTDYGMAQDYRILSRNHDVNGLEFLSTIEHKTLPIFGTQWHPEKNAYEWKYDSIPHSADAVAAAQYISDTFVAHARLNDQRFLSDVVEEQNLIYKYHTTYTGNSSSSFVQVYFFK